MPGSPRARSLSRARGDGRSVVAAAGGGGGGSTYQSAVLVDTPLAYWRMGDASGTTMTDASGNARTGTYVGTPTLAASGLIIGDTDTAVTLNGTTQYATVTYGSWMNQATFTIEALVKGSFYGASNTILDRRTGTGFANQSWQFRVANGLPQLLIMNSSSVTTYQAPTVLVAGVAYHIAVTVSSTTVVIYLNGAVKYSGSLVAAPNTTVSAITVGASASTTSELFSGTVDEVAYYAGALV